MILINCLYRFPQNIYSDIVPLICVIVYWAMDKMLPPFVDLKYLQLLDVGQTHSK